jgi:Cft2 family RNA processing exonuclease
MTEPEEFESTKGGMIPRKISVAYISFSAHVDYSQNSEFIELVKAQHVVNTGLSNFMNQTLTAVLGFSSRGANSHGTSESSHDVKVQRAGRGC